MKTLLLMRHAKSSWKDPRITGHQRPLNKRGKRAVADMGARFKTRGLRPDLFLSSDARRALDTATAICQALDMPASEIQADPGLYLATPERILSIVHELDDRWQQVMLFGHNPGFLAFANRFYPQPIAKLPTAGIVELVFDIRHWRDIEQQRLMDSRFDFPKNKS